MKIIGIDVGLTGALACLQKYRDGIKIYSAIDMPLTGQDTKTRVDVHALAAWVRGCAADGAAIEYAQTMPAGAGSFVSPSSAFRYGDSFGSARSCIALCGVPFVLVSPRVWKKEFGLSGSDKELSRQKAIDLFPDDAKTFARKKDHARAEAALIALYQLRKM